MWMCPVWLFEKCVNTILTKLCLINNTANREREFLLPADVLVFLSLGRLPGAVSRSPVPLINRLIPRSITQWLFRRMGADMGAMGGTKFLLLVLMVGWEKSLGLNWNPVPRKTVRYQGEGAVSEGGTIVAAHFPNLSLCPCGNYSCIPPYLSDTLICVKTFSFKTILCFLFM